MAAQSPMVAPDSSPIGKASIFWLDASFLSTRSSRHHQPGIDRKGELSREMQLCGNLVRAGSNDDLLLCDEG